MTDPHGGTERRSRFRPWSLVIALLGVVALVAAACPADDDVTDPVDDPVDGAISIGWIPWDEDVAVTFLWEYILEEQGFDVELVGPLDVAPVYTGVAEGDIDLFLDSWLPVTHEDFLEEHGAQMEDLGIWYDQATLHISVPDYVEIDSLTELADQGEMFGNQIIGIEPGAGLMRLTMEEVVPTYGLDDWEVVEGSTPAMLAELERATDAEEPIAVTLWRPHWAYAAFPIKDLEDPEGALGAAEQIHIQARDGFSADFPEVAQWLGNFELDADSLNALTFLVIEEYGDGQEREAVLDWLEDPDNQALVDSWLE